MEDNQCERNIRKTVDIEEEEKEKEEETIRK